MIQAVLERCAGVNVGKRTIAVCLMTGPADAEPTTDIREFGTFMAELEAMKQWLLAAGCAHVVMESTGCYWKPIFNVLEDNFEVYLANAQDVKGRKGHKTDRKDCWWLAHLLRHAMIRTSFVPPRPIPELRDLTRRRKRLLSTATSERNRVQKVLEDANIKLGSVLSDVFGVSGQWMLDALLEGNATPDQIAQLAQRGARKKIPEILASLQEHHMREHHRFMIHSSLEHLRFLEEQINALDEEIQRRIQAAGIGRQLELLHTVPGVGPESATVMLAELGPDMQPFPTPQRLISWAGVCPGNKRSAGKDFRGHTTRGNKYRRAALTECAWAVSHTKNSPLRDKFWRLAVGGKKRAVVAVAHALLLIVYQVLATGQPRQIRAAPLPDERAQQRMILHHLRCLGRLGVSTRSRRAVHSSPLAKPAESSHSALGGQT